MLLDLINKPANFWLARGVARSTTAQALCARLEGKVMQVAPGVTNLSGHFRVLGGVLELQPGVVDEPDAVLAGSPLSLARLGLDGDPQNVIRSGQVRITGDEEIAADFQALLDLVSPDWEEELAQLIGDIPAHQAGRAARRAGGWLRAAGNSLSRSLGEYLTEESRSVVAQPEIEAFSADVDELAAAVDRAEARLRLLQAARDES